MEIVLGTSELGGFGDVVAAAKIGEGLAMQGHDVTYKFYSEAARWKAKALFPGRDFPPERKHCGYTCEDVLKIDAIKSVPATDADIFVGEIDRYSLSGAPIRLQPGFHEKHAYVSTPIRGSGEGGGSVVVEFQQLSPTFYRPFSLDRLPNPGEENIRDVVTENIGSMDGSAVKRALGECQRIGVCYTYNSNSIIGFVEWLSEAASASSERLGIIVLTKCEIEDEVRLKLIESKLKYTVIGSDGEVHDADGSNLLVAVMATQPQEITTRLFWSAEMPNYVTGGQSLSDAVYGLVFGKGQGFLYEACDWKVVSRDGIFKMMNDFDPVSANTFMQCTNLISERNPNDENPLAPVFSSSRQMNTYTHIQREALLQALRGRNPVLTSDSVTVQGSVGRVVDKISSDPSIMDSLRDRQYAPRTINGKYQWYDVPSLTKKNRVW